MILVKVLLEKFDFMNGFSNFSILNSTKAVKR